MNSSLKLKPNSSDQSANTVSIYIRNYKKQASMVSVTTPISTRELTSLVAKKYHTEVDHIALFLNGERLDNMEANLDLKEKAIVHIVYMDRTNVHDLTVFFKSPTQQESVLKVVTSPYAQIKSIFSSKVQPFFGKSEKQAFFAYLGRPINIFKTFHEELIEDECEILVLQFKRAQLKHIEILNNSLSKHDISFASTKQLGMPVFLGGDRSRVDKNQEKKKQVNKMKPFKIKSTNIQAEAAPQDVQKNESGVVKLHSQKVEINIAPSEESAAPSVFAGFDPHSQKPCFSKSKQPEEKLIKAPCQTQKTQKQNPQADFCIAPKDFLYMASSVMDQTQQFSAGVVHDYKQNFLKKKSSGNSGKENKN